MKTIKKKLSFKAYYDNLSVEEKRQIRQLMVPVYLSYPSFYDKIKNDKFSELELEKLELLTGENFTR